MYEIRPSMYNYVKFFSLYKDGKIVKNYTYFRAALNRIDYELYIKPNKTKKHGSI